MSYGISTIEHVGSLADNWFQQREAEITQLFDELKSRYGGKRLGDFQNETPGLTDSSGAAVDKNNLRDNPQANWMTNQVVGGAASHAESAPAILQDSPIIAAFQTMVDSFDSSSISDDLAKALGDIETLAKSLFDPDNANAADGAATIAILDLLEHLILAVLKAIDGLTHALFTFLSSSAQAVVDWFNTPLEGYGLLSALYDWVRPDGEPKTDMTAADLFFLTVAFFVTVIYKLINGVDHPPFPSGTFPAIPAPPWHKDYDPEFVADDPASYNQDMAIVQIACGACGIVAAFVEFGTDVAPATPILEGADTNFWLALAELVFSTVMFNVVSNCPPIGGDAWATETEVPGFYVATPATGVFAMACITFVLQGATVIVNRVKPDLAKSPIMKNVFDGKGGPIINTIISSISLGCMAASCAQTSANPYSSAQNTIQFIPGVLQVVRLKVSDTDESYPWRCLIIGVIDLLCNLTSAIMTVIGAATSAFTQRVAISAQQFQPAQVGMTYSEAVQYSGANATYNAPPQKWTVRTGQLPSGLNLNPQTGKIEGVPTLVTGTTPASFTVRCTDSFGPPQYSDDSTALQLSVNPSIVGSLAFTNSQASQSTPVSTVGLGQPLVVTVMSNQTTPQPVVGAGVLVTLPAAVNGASATFYADGTSSTILTTGSDGTVTIPDFVTNAYTGQWSVTAAVPGIGAATATYLITNASSPVASIVPGTGATPQSILGPDVLPPGPGVFPYAITATLNDKNGNPVPNTVVTFTETGASMNKNHWYGWFQSNYQTSMTVTSDQNGNVSAGTFSNKYQGGAPYPLPVPLYVLTGPFSITAAVPGSPAKTEYKLTNRPKST